ncbi:hypothetical protein [Streptomyces sp. NPDC059378]|uniref:hypothetical protein n=1 Tax=Streptomyces sp. NPDC059378 TaxID=3346815 RepID=UPI0036C1CA88
MHVVTRRRAPPASGEAWLARVALQASKVLAELPPHAVVMLCDALDIAGCDSWT